MKQHFSRLVLALLALFLFGLVLTACGGNEAEVPTPTPEPVEEATEVPPTDTPVPPTNTPEPSPTPQPSPTPEPSPTPDPAAGFIDYESAEGGFSLRYPDGWFTQELFGLAIFASAEELLDSPDPGEEGGVIVVVTGETADFEGDFGTTDPAAVLEQSTGDLGFGEDATFVEGPTATTINGQDAATAVINATSDNGTPLAGLIAIIINGDRAAVVFGATPQETGEDFLPTFQTIVNTIEVMEPTVIEEEPPTDSEAVTDTEGFLLFGDQFTGTVPEGDVSTWEFIGLEGETVDIVVEPLSEELDVIVDVQDESGASILESGPIDDSFGTEEIRNLAIPAAGTYYVVVQGFAADDFGDYQISFTEAGGGTTVAAPGDLAYGDATTGSLAAENDTASFSFNGSEGDIVFVRVDPAGELDVIVDILDAVGESILDSGRDNSFGKEVVGTVLPTSGVYDVVVTPFTEEDTGEFDLQLSGPAGSVIYTADTLEESGETHAFPFTASTGNLVALTVAPEGDLDVVVEIYNEDTDEQLFEIDRSFATEALGWEAPETGNYYFLVSGFVPEEEGEEGGADVGAYDATFFGSSAVFLELAYGDTVAGRLPAEIGIIEYLFNGTAGDTIALTLETEPEIDGVLEILDLDDNVLVSVDDTLAGEGETLTYTFESDGLVIVRVSDFFGAGGRFDLLVDAVTE